MKRYLLSVTPHASLFFGGYAENRGSSDGDTARDDAGLVIPGSVVKGALREAALRLLRGKGEPLDENEIQREVGRIFGNRPRDRLQPETWEGPLRIGPLRAEEGAEATLRHHVSLERANRQAAPGRLFQNRVTPAGHGLCFQGFLGLSRELGEEEMGLLRAAVCITDQIGGGRGRGLGLVRLELAEEAEKAAAEAADPLAAVELQAGESHTLTLVLEAREPLRLGSVKDGTNLQTSKSYLDGSALRGATAAVLAQHDPGQLEAVLGGGSPVCFGDARPGGPSAIPAPCTLRAPKRGAGLFFDQALRLAAGTHPGRDFATREGKGTVAMVEGRWVPIKPKLRTVTRSARNPADGRAEHGLLFSLQIMDPLQRLRPGLDRRNLQQNLRFHAPISGSPEQLRSVAGAAGHGLTVGGTRGRGMGGMVLAEVSNVQAWPSLPERHAAWAEAVRREAGKGGEDSGVLLALGPVALDSAELRQALANFGLAAIDGRVRRDTLGGWNRKAGLPRALRGVFLPGSTWILRTLDGGHAAAPLADLETRGLGPGRADGWGRLVACHPIHLDCLAEKEN